MQGGIFSCMTQDGKQANCSRDPVAVKAAIRLARRAGHKVSGKMLGSSRECMTAHGKMAYCSQVPQTDSDQKRHSQYQQQKKQLQSQKKQLKRQHQLLENQQLELTDQATKASTEITPVSTTTTTDRRKIAIINVNVKQNKNSEKTTTDKTRIGRKLLGRGRSAHQERKEKRLREHTKREVAQLKRDNKKFKRQMQDDQKRHKAEVTHTTQKHNKQMRVSKERHAKKIRSIQREKQSATEKSEKTQLNVMRKSAKELKISGTMQCWSKKVLLKNDISQLYKKQKLMTPTELLKKFKNSFEGKGLKDTVATIHDLYGRLALMSV